MQIHFEVATDVAKIDAELKDADDLRDRADRDAGDGLKLC